MSDTTPTPAESGQQIAFIHILRGTAPLLVLWAHLGGWWLAEAHQTSVLENTWLNLVCRPLHLYQDGGHLGVLIFFLVSGFVITHVSLRETLPEFVIKRVFRLWPTMLFALALLPVVVWATQALGLPLVLATYSNAYVRGAFLLNYFTGAPQVLTVLWTLFIEVLFYALTAGFLNLSRVRPALATWLMLAVPHVWSMAAIACPALLPPMWGVMYVPFLIVGRCIYLGWAGKIPPLHAAVAATASYLSFVLIVNTITPSLLLKPGGEPILSHLYALLLFLALCSAGLKRTPRFFAFAADVSYPLYLVHAPVGGFIIFLLTKHGLPFELAIFVAMAAVMALAWVMHRVMEVPLQKKARELCAYLGVQYREPGAPPAGS